LGAREGQGLNTAVPHKFKPPVGKSFSPQSGLTPTPSLQRRLAQSWCPLELRTNSSPHSAQTNSSCDTLLCFLASITLTLKKPPRERRVEDYGQVRRAMRSPLEDHPL